MYQIEQFTQNRPAAAGVCLVIGFTGSVVGLVYAWSYVFDKGWFIIWFLGAVYFAVVGIREWYVEKLTHLQQTPPPAPTPESRTIEKNNVEESE